MPVANGSAVPDVPPIYTAPPPPAYVAPAPPPAPVEAVAPGVPPLEIALAEVREVLGAHSVRVEPILRRAEPTLEGMRAAAESLRERRVRLLSPATMELAADRILAALDSRAASAPLR
jgi:hypothetical protein